MINFNNSYNRTDFLVFLEEFLPDDFVETEEKYENLGFNPRYTVDATKLGTCPSMELDVFEITHTSSHDARVGIAQDAFRLMLYKSYNNRALVIFKPEGSPQYRFSLLQIEAEVSDQTARITRSYSNPRRYSFLMGEGAHTKTPEQFLLEKGKLKPQDGDYFKDLQDRFSVEVLTKEFYRELSNWYFWAIKNVSFPNDINDDSDNDKFNPENVIRLITRLIFVWFLKQKELVANDLFDKEALKSILKEFQPESDKQGNYYRAILQNLFFATLNQEVDKRAFAPDKGYLENRSTSGIKNFYRYEKEFKVGTSEVMSLFGRIPFLNGGLFECLDGKEKESKMFYWDGFSRNPKRQAQIPNHLFFASEQTVDLSSEYNDTRMRAVKVSGIIEILGKYNFTIEENTPVEIQVALDPELLGKVFENLLGAFNPETKETARKQTGSFYTPREIVNYMVNESLIAYYQSKVPEVKEETLRALFSYEDKSCEITPVDKEKLVKATFEARILDPACGSGAFPMGILQQLVHVLKKLDPDNTQWNNVVLDQAINEFENAENEKEDDNADIVAEIESTFEKGLNFPDYTRKLYLIENCIYGVDIQSIAVQISKLRFFISLICEQHRNENPADNFGIRPLPNLETKFVAANTLIGIEKNEEDMAYFNDDHIKKLIDRLKNNRHRQFLVTNATRKKELRKKDEDLRLEIVNEVKQLYVKHADEHLARYRRELKTAEMQLTTLEKTPDDIRIITSTDLFGNETTTTYNHTEKHRKELKQQLRLLNDKITLGSDYSRLNAVVNLAKQLTSWNPYDQNASSPFFDPEWMFGFKEGFDVVIGNPPYGAKLNDVEKKIYKEKYITTKTIRGIQKGSMDSYTIFIELGYNLLSVNGNLSYIVPISVTSSDALSGVHKLLESNCKEIRVSSYAVRPQPVFENAVVNTSILHFLKTKTPNEVIYSTKMYRKGKGFNLQALINNLQFAEVKDLKLFGRIPKIGSDIEKSILKKILKAKPISDFIDETGHPIYYRTTGGRYFKIVTNYSTGSTKEKSILFNRKSTNSIGCILSSNLSFWFYQIFSNNLDWKFYEISSFTIPNLTSENKKELEKLYSLYQKDVENNASIRTTSESSSYNVSHFKEYKIGKSKHIIDKIDDLICPLYGLTQEELEFIKNYEIEFRISDEE